MKNNRLKYSIASLSVLLSLSSCWFGPKEETTIVSGKVINSGSKEPIEGAYVSLRDGGAYAPGPFSVGSDLSSETVDETKTDGEGKFRLEIKGIHEATLRVSKENYSYEYIIAGSTQSFRPFSGVNENVILEMDAEAFFAPTLKRKVPIKEKDWVSIETSFYDNGRFSRSGFIVECYDKTICPAFHNVPYRAKGDKYLLYRLKYKKDGQLISVIDSVYIKSFETFRDTIYY